LNASGVSPAGPATQSTATTAADQHLFTGHLLRNLEARTISSGFVTVFSQGVQFVMNLASVMVLARLLTPKDFGLVAMVTTITGFLRIFNEAGLSTATVQREGITHAQVSNLFWTNVALGGAISLLLAALSPAVAWFYGEPRLVAVTLSLCITFLLTSSAVQHLALLKRQMRFKIIAFIEITSMLIGVLVGVGMALLKFGYWSLVGMQLSTPVMAFLLTWWASRWRPQLPSRCGGTRSLLTFGANLTASSFLWSLARGSDGLLIGRVYGSTSLGLYSRAAALLSRPVQQLLSPIEAVFLPTLSRLQDQPERYRRTIFRVFDMIALFSFPLSAIFLALSHPLTLVVLGHKWESAAGILAGFSLVALAVPLCGIASWLITSQGRGKDFLLQSVVGSSVTITSFCVGLPFGPVGVATTYSLAILFIAVPIAYYIAGRTGPVTARDLWTRLIKHLPLWGVVCGATWLAAKAVGGLAPVLQMLISVPAGLLVGAVFALVYPPSRRAVANIVEAFQHWKRSRTAITDSSAAGK
jgi:PST family polysaccharide transporter